MPRRIAAWNESRRVVGLRSSLHWLLIRLATKCGLKEPSEWRVRPYQLRYSLNVRLRNSSDMDAFYLIFYFDEYSTIRNLQNVSLVLDLGANAGFSSAYFLNSFPESRILAVEPDERNVSAYRNDLAPYGNRVRLLHGAVWSECKRLRLSSGSFGDGREWATQVAEPVDGSAGEVQAWDVNTLINMAGCATVDLLKIDIERSELEVFGESAKKWLPRVRNICIELHGPDCEAVFFGALAGYDYDLERSGELTICRNLRSAALPSAPLT
jgi:FkbM family methyltransferase